MTDNFNKLLNERIQQENNRHFYKFELDFEIKSCSECPFSVYGEDATYHDEYYKCQLYGIDLLADAKKMETYNHNIHAGCKLIKLQEGKR
jgi:hypothetical protein